MLFFLHINYLDFLFFLPNFFILFIFNKKNFSSLKKKNYYNKKDTYFEFNNINYFDYFYFNKKNKNFSFQIIDLKKKSYKYLNYGVHFFKNLIFLKKKNYKYFFFFIKKKNKLLRNINSFFYKFSIFSLLIKLKLTLNFFDCFFLKNFFFIKRNVLKKLISNFYILEFFYHKYIFIYLFKVQMFAICFPFKYKKIYYLKKTKSIPFFYILMNNYFEQNNFFSFFLFDYLSFSFFLFFDKKNFYFDRKNLYIFNFFFNSYLWKKK